MVGEGRRGFDAEAAEDEGGGSSVRGGGGGEGAGEGRCPHVPCLVARAEDGESFYGRCLACGRIGPGRPTSEAARDALVPEDPEQERGG